MNDPMLEMQPWEDGRAEAGESPARTHEHAMAAMSFTLSWQSENARHLDCLVANKLNLWRDVLPPQMEPDLMDKPVGHVAKRDFSAGELLTGYQVFGDN